MGKLEYLDALKHAMLGLPPELQAKTLAWYEQRFVDGSNAGRREDEVARELDDPKKVALSLRANTHMNAFAVQKNPANLLRMLVSSVGLLIFNLFMVIPAAVFGSLLAGLYVAAFAFYVGGIAVTASGLAGANELVLDGPLSHVLLNGGRGEPGERRTRVSIGDHGVILTQGEDSDPGPRSPSRVLRGAERVVGSTLEISTLADEQSRTTQTVLGLCMVLCGIVGFLVSLGLTRYAALGVKRYLHMNMALLRGH